jgi:nucleotide-binding universal stress UspA family protein
MGDTIVVGTDGSASAGVAVDEAVRLAAALGGELHIVSAYRAMRMSASSLPNEFAGAISSAARVDAVLEEAAARARVGDVSATLHAVEDDPADALLTVVENVNATMLVVGNKGLNSVKRFVLGSVPSKVIHHAPCTVHIVHTT